MRCVGVAKVCGTGVQGTGNRCMGGVRCVVSEVEGCGRVGGMCVGVEECGGRGKVCGGRGGGEFGRVLCGWGR